MKEISSITDIFKALADPTRLRICAVLIGNELSVNEIVELFAMGQSRISRHLKILTDCGLLLCRRDGLRSFYSVPSSGDERRFIDDAAYLWDGVDLISLDRAKVGDLLRKRTERAVRYFNRVASLWTRERAEILSGFDLNSAILPLVRDSNVVVDLGCGNGELLCMLSRTAQHAIGVDNSTRMIETARKNGTDAGLTLDLRIGEVDHLPLRDGEADVAVMALTLHHLSRPDLAFLEISRVLNQSGKIIIVDFEKHTDENMRLQYHDHWLGFSRDELQQWLASARMKISSYESVQLNTGLSLALTSAIKYQGDTQ
jgi:ArsR family transcriptional regulator